MPWWGWLLIGIVWLLTKPEWLAYTVAYAALPAAYAIWFMVFVFRVLYWHSYLTVDWIRTGEKPLSYEWRLSTLVD